MVASSETRIEGTIDNPLPNTHLNEDLVIAVHQMITDPSNPYYLHYGDNTCIQIISVILSDENYSWSRTIEMTLSMKNKEGFIDGSIPIPSIDSPLYPAWRRCNHVVSLWIINSIPKELYPSVMHKDSARQIWLELRDRYSQGNGPRIYQLKKLIVSISQGNGSVSAYFNRLKGLWEELFNYRPQSHNSYYEEEQILQFLMGLDDSYSNVRSQILMTEPLPSLNKVFALVQQDERQNDVASKNQNNVEAAEFVSRLMAGSMNSDVNQRPMSYGVNQRTMYNNQNFKKDRPKCSYCGMLGYLHGKCYKLHGYPLGHRLVRDTGKEIISSANQVTTSPNLSNVFSGLTITPEQCQQVLNILKPQLQTQLSNLAFHSGAWQTGPLRPTKPFYRLQQNDDSTKRRRGTLERDQTEDQVHNFNSQQC